MRLPTGDILNNPGSPSSTMTVALYVAHNSRTATMSSTCSLADLAGLSSPAASVGGRYSCHEAMSACYVGGWKGGILSVTPVEIAEEPPKVRFFQVSYTMAVAVPTTSSRRSGGHRHCQRLLTVVLLLSLTATVLYKRGRLHGRGDRQAFQRSIAWR